MDIPLLDLKAQYATVKDEIIRAINDVCESQYFALGPAVAQFEENVAAYCGSKFAIGVSSGTDALLISLMALEVGPGDEVITSPFTFFATAGCVARVGARPVFVDIDPRSFNIDPGAIEEKITEKTKAIIPVHLFGQIADMKAIAEIAQRHNIAVIEDAAQAIGAEYRGQKVGTIGHFGCFSFFPTKNLGAYGDGGLVVTNDDELAEKVRMLRVHGSKPKYYHHLVGTNSRLDALQAAILRAKLPHLDEWTAARQKIAARYDELLRDIPGIEIPYRAPDRTHIFHQYTIRVLNGRRDALQKHLKEQGVGTQVYYPLPLHLQPCFRHLGYKEGDLPESERASREVLSLPMFPELTAEEQDYVVQKICEFVKGDLG